MRTKIRLLSAAPPDTFAVCERDTDRLIGIVRHHTHLEGEHYWTVGDDPEAPSYGSRADAVSELVRQSKQ